MPMGDNLRKRAGRSWSRLEALLALGTGAAAEPIAGIAGLAGLLGGLDRGARNVEATRNALTYQPRDPRGMQELGQALAPIVEPYERAKNYMGDGVLEATGSPGLATAAYTAPDALAALVGLRTAGMKGPSMQQMAERSAGPGMGQPASQVGAIGAWHGSPHDFDRFDMSAIGTGEGAQAYGHGLYFAGKPEVAESYRKTLAASHGAQYRLPNGEVIQASHPDIAIALDDIARRGVRDGADWFEWGDADLNSPQGPQIRELIGLKDKIMAAGALEKLPNRSDGRLYNVELAPDETDLLDWDAPLSQQPEKVRKALEANRGVIEERINRLPGPTFRMDEHVTGEQLMRLLGAKDAGVSAVAASNLLRGLGIPGLRYLDGKSRDAGQGTRNYVMFDDSLVQIKGKE